MQLSRTVASAVVVTALLALTAPPSSAQAAPADSLSGGTARFVQIDNVEGFSGFFNIARGTVRIVALLSPTCPECVASYGEIVKIMQSTPNRRLRSYVVFMPVRPSDTRAIALSVLAQYQDRRVSYFWDPNFAVGEMLKPVVGSDTRVEDGCFVFDTSASIRASADEPSLWMRQHAHGDAPAFDAAAVEKRVRELLARLVERQRRQATEDEE